MRHNRSIRQRFPFAGLVMLFLAAPLFGSTLVSVTYNLAPDEFEGGDTQIWAAESWTQTGSYTDVTIRATLLREVLNSPPGDGTAFLEQKVGNHAIQIASADFVFPKNEAEIKLFAGLSLGPGTYYLSVFGQGFWLSDYVGGTPDITTASDVSDVTSALVSQDGGHTFVDDNSGVYNEFSVTGTEVPVSDTPEPATGLILGATLLLGAVVKRRALSPTLQAEVSHPDFSDAS